MLSTLIITKNEEKDIMECLEDIKEISDEIIIVDSYSNDKTRIIAKKYTSKIYLRKFDNFSNQRNYAIKKAKGDWLFIIDPDEGITRESANKISKLINLKKYIGFVFPRRNYINSNTWLQHGIFYPDYQVRLFKNNTIYKGEVHERPLLNFESLKKVNDVYIIHKSTRSIYKNFYSPRRLFTENYIYLEAKANANNKSLQYYLFSSPISSIILFVRGFIFNKGYLDGWAGFRAALIFSIYRIIVDIYTVLLKLKVNIK